MEARRQTGLRILVAPSSSFRRSCFRVTLSPSIHPQCPGFSCFCLHCGQGLEASRSNEQLLAGVIKSSKNVVLNNSRLAASSSPLQLGRCFYFGARACGVQICAARRFARHPDSCQLFGERQWRPRAERGAGRLSRKLRGGAGFGRFTRDGPVLHETGSKLS